MGIREKQDPLATSQQCRDRAIRWDSLQAGYVVRLLIRSSRTRGDGTSILNRGGCGPGRHRHII